MVKNMILLLRKLLVLMLLQVIIWDYQFMAKVICMHGTVMLLLQIIGASTMKL